MNSGIYKWTNKINGKIYIGQAINLNNRMRAFLSFKTAYAGKLINEEREKYPSLKYWDYDVLEECDGEKLDELEIKYIKEIPLEKSLNFEYSHKQYNAVVNKKAKEVKKRTQLLPLTFKNYTKLLEEKIIENLNNDFDYDTHSLQNIINIIHDKKCKINGEYVGNNSDFYIYNQKSIKIPHLVYKKYNINDKYDLMSLLMWVRSCISWELSFDKEDILCDTVSCVKMGINEVDLNTSIIVNETFYNITIPCFYILHI